MPARCTPSATETVYETFQSKVETVETVISSIPVVLKDTVTVFPTATVTCPEQENVRPTPATTPPTDPSDKTDGSGLLGSLSLPFRKRAPAACTPRTLLGSSTIKGSTSFELQTVVISRGSIFQTSTPVKTLFAPCEETQAQETQPAPSSSAEASPTESIAETSQKSSPTESSSSEHGSHSDILKQQTSVTTQTSSRWRTVTQSSSGLASASGQQLEASNSVSNGSSSSASNEDGSGARVGAIAGSTLGAVAGVLILIVLARYIYRAVSKKAAGSDVDSLFDFAATNHHDDDSDQHTESSAKDVPVMRELSQKTYRSDEKPIRPASRYDPSQFYVPARPVVPRQSSLLDNYSPPLSQKRSERTLTSGGSNNANAAVSHPIFDAHTSVYSSISSHSPPGGRRIASSYFENSGDPLAALAPPLPTRFNPYADEAHSPVPQAVGAVNRGSVEVPKGILKVRNGEQQAHSNLNADDPYAAIGR